VADHLFRGAHVGGGGGKGRRFTLAPGERKRGAANLNSDKQGYLRKGGEGEAIFQEGIPTQR